MKVYEFSKSRSLKYDITVYEDPKEPFARVRAFKRKRKVEQYWIPNAEVGDWRARLAAQGHDETEVEKPREE